MATIDVWLEGAHHPFEENGAWYGAHLCALGHEVRFPDLDTLLAPDAPEADLWILGGLVYSAMGDGYRPLTEAQADKLKARVAHGRPLLALHCVIGSWSERPEFDTLWDGRWDWETSNHSPVEPFPVRIADPDHPLTAGLADFEVVDELYYNLRPTRDSHIVLEADYEGKRWPLAWCREKPGPYVFLGLGHDLRSLGNPAYAAFLDNALDYLLKR